MSDNMKRNEDCLRGGCERWFNSVKANREISECERCGFNRAEDARRKTIPLVKCADGLRRIIIPAKPPLEREVVEDEECE